MLKFCNSSATVNTDRMFFPSAKALLFSVSSLSGGESAAQSTTSVMKRIRTRNLDILPQAAEKENFLISAKINSDHKVVLFLRHFLIITA